ncbi:hypothetical protein BBK36DRAFT_1134688 [Trichoderma citrinoviride]|uniref:Uncharacterized protein n=1 Tax=Trichoderma citrinoviride TaxID=58853 RepID=A0A2T4BIK9_9HYPO|nr:hypothetical protein BBK36DRAFT_1134688 [Trichoderma citrinoviride]PTB69157.1 hypothetical protein BBK36DRAFT_1134688 [Trichoderma citrinoviride]
MPPPPLETLRSTTPAPPPPPPPSSPSPYSPVNKPPTPPFPTCLSQQQPQNNNSNNNNIEVQLPPLVAGALVASFARTLADGLGSGSELLLAHYYVPHHRRLRPNLDIVVDRLMAAFARQLWDELFRFYHDADQQPSGGRRSSQLSRQVELLFQGPVRQLVLILNGPEAARCVLDELGPGLSRRPLTWASNDARGIDLELALQLLCGFWHRAFPELSPGGSPEQIARALHTLVTTGDAARSLVDEMRRLLLSPHHVQMHFAESAIWDIVLKRPGRPPADGFHIVQFKYECQLLNPLGGFGDLAYIRLASLPVVTGTAAEHVCVMTVAEYTERQWPRCGPVVLGCLDEALFNAASSLLQGEAFSGMSVWDGSDGRGARCPGLRFVHVETEGSWIRMSVSARPHTLVDVFQHMSWFCAAVSASPFPGVVAESATEVSDWAYVDGNVYVSCSLSHSPVPEADGLPWLRSLPRSAIASGFPVDGAPCSSSSSDVVM